MQVLSSNVSTQDGDRWLYGKTHNTECTDEDIRRRGIARHHLRNEVRRHADDSEEGHGLEHADYPEGRPKGSVHRSGHLVEGFD